jgi:hypothetical protein
MIESTLVGAVETDDPQERTLAALLFDVAVGKRGA